MSAPHVSVVIPCLNESATVGACVQVARDALAELDQHGEVSVVDNGSSDRSAELAQAAGARVLREPRRGYGRAYLTGFEAAAGDYLVMGDADLTYDFKDTPGLSPSSTRVPTSWSATEWRRSGRARCRGCTSTSATR